MIRYLFDTEGMMTPIENVTQHPKNDNNGDVEEIVASMRTDGVYRPIYASTRSGYIVAGNHTYLALLELGAKFVPVQWVDCPDEYSELRILAKDNKIARLARPEPERTRDLLAEILALSPAGRDTEAALVGTGYRPSEYQALLREPEPLDLSNLRGSETLEHRITCPECGHTWTRSGGHEED